MLKNKLFVLTSLLVIASLASCAKESSKQSEKPAQPGVTTDIVIPLSDDEQVLDKEPTYADGLFLNHKVVGLFEGEQYELKGLRQAHNDGKSLNFVSKDTSIATVDENGVITGVKVGETTIEVSDKNNPELKKDVPVYVHAEVTQTRPKQRLLNALGDINEDDLDAIVDHELYQKKIYKNGVLQKDLCWDQNLVCSYPDAYFRIYETDAESITEGGATTFSNYEWVFYTNKYYDTYVYHQSGDIKTFYPVSTVYYMDEGKERYAPMFDILDNLFTSGREIFTQTFTNAKLSGFLDYATASYSNIEKGSMGSLGTNEDVALGKGSFLFDCKVTYANETASQDDESRYGIPYGTPCPTVYNLRFHVENNQVVGYTNHGVMSYEIGDDKYEEVYDIDHFYERITAENKATFVSIPDKTQYTLVDYLFAI